MSSSRLGLLGAVFGTALLAILDAGSVERAAHGVVANARQVLDATAADEHDRVLLQVVAFAADVRNDLVPVGQAHFGDLAKRRVRLLRGRGVHAGAHAAALRAVGERGRRALVGFRAARLAHQLVDRCHLELLVVAGAPTSRRKPGLRENERRSGMRFRPAETKKYSPRSTFRSNAAIPWDQERRMRRRTWSTAIPPVLGRKRGAPCASFRDLEAARHRAPRKTRGSVPEIRSERVASRPA